MKTQQKDMTPEEIKAALVVRGITQRSIARDLGVSHITVHRVIHNNRPSHRIREAIANKIGLTAAEVWRSLYPMGVPRKRGRPASRDSGTARAA